LTAGVLSRETDLAASARPVLEVEASAEVSGIGVVAISGHRFTLDIERAADEMFSTDLLADFDLDGRRDDLGAALVESFEDGGANGCEALSQVACGAAGRAATCIEAACAAIGPALDARLLAWIAALSDPGTDFELSGVAAIRDVDLDLEVDEVGGGAELTGSWQVSVDTAAGPSNGAAAFGGVR
jgi:hypothetical protein